MPEKTHTIPRYLDAGVDRAAAENDCAAAYDRKLLGVVRKIINRKILTVVRAGAASQLRGAAIGKMLSIILQ